jgi:hypothetical protein
MQDETSGYSLLLKRMKSHPEEFTIGSKATFQNCVWFDEIRDLSNADFINDEEKQHFMKELGKLQEAAFNQRVIKKLLLRDKHAHLDDRF